MREFKIELQFVGQPSFSTVQTAASMRAALADAERYARSCGWTAAIKKRFCWEVQK